jgi:hypothetical protein
MSTSFESISARRRAFRRGATRAGGMAVAVALAAALAPFFVQQASASPGANGSPGASSGSCAGPPGFGSRYMGSTWPGGFRGVPVYSNGISGSFTDCLHSTRTPKGRWVVDGYEWQCVELVDRLYLSKGWINSSWLGDGGQLFSTAPGFLHKQAQGSITAVHPGDVISFSAPGGGGGHAAVISEVRGNYLTIVNQNTDYSAMISHAYLEHGSIVMVGWAGWGPIGVIHAPADASAPPPLRVATSALPTGRVNDSYRAVLMARGGTGHDSWSLRQGTLPGGLHLARDGVVYGTAFGVGRYRFVAEVRDSKHARAERPVSLEISPSSNLLSDGSFTTRRRSPWLASGTARAVVHHGVVGVPGFRRLGSDVVLSSGRAGGSMHEDVRTTLDSGHSFSFGAWVRASSRSGSARVKVCLVVSARPRASDNRTCTTVGPDWSWVVAPYDVTTGHESVLRAQVEVGSVGGRVVVARASLFGNGLLHASFQRRETINWSTLPAGLGGVVHDPAIASGGLPEGGDTMVLSASRGEGSVFQDLSTPSRPGQQFHFSAWLREAAVVPASGSAVPAKVCLVLWGRSSHKQAQQCVMLGASWDKVSVSFTTTRFERGLRAQIFVLTPGHPVLVDATQVVNSTP